MGSAKAAVLVVEDERNLADLYADWLADTYVVRTAYGGESALEELDADVDVVLLDRRMPGLSGDEVLDAIRDRGLDCRVVIVSAVTPDFDVIGMGFDDYLTKPVDAEELEDAVERMLRRGDLGDTLLEYEQLVAARSALEAEKSLAQLDGNEEYEALQERIREVQARADETFEEFSDDDFDAAFRDLEQDLDAGSAEFDQPDSE